MNERSARRRIGARGVALCALAAAASCHSPGPPANDVEAPTAPADPPPEGGVGFSSGGDGSPATSTSSAPCRSADETPLAAPDVVLTIHPNSGPKGAPAPVRVDRRFFGMNIADWRDVDYVPTPDPLFLTYLSALRPGVLRWPAGHRSQGYVWERGGPGQTGEWTLTTAHADAFMSLARTVGAEPIVGINVKTGTLAAAVDLVRYLNVERGYGVKYFQIGNEPDLVDGITPDPATYVRELVSFSDAIRAVDPSIRIVGPELLTGAHVGGIHGTVDWMTPILAGGGSRLDAISWHYYPLDSGQTLATSSAILSFAHLFQETAPDWRPAGLSFVDEIMPLLGSLRSTYAPSAEIWVTEIAEDPGPGGGTGISETVAAALWVADVLGRYGEYGPGAMLRWIFKADPPLAYALIDENDQPHATYGAYWLYARSFGDRFVDAASSAITDVSVHAALRDDGALTLMLANKTTTSRRVLVTVDGFCATSADAMTLDGDGLAATTFRVNGRTFGPDDATATPSPLAVDTSQLFGIEMPPTSIRLIAYHP